MIGFEHNSALCDSKGTQDTSISARTRTIWPADIRWQLFVLSSAVSFAIAIVIMQVVSGAYRADLSMVSDESAHYVSALMICDYVLHGLSESPLRFAIDYYHHFPRVALGHWPPLFHIVQAAAFALFGRAVQTAIAFQAGVAALLCTFTAALVSRRYNRLVGIAAGLAIFASPVVMTSTDEVMVDTFLAVLVMVCALTWAKYAKTGASKWAVLFGFNAAAAILTKGNGIGILGVPVLYILLSRRFDLMRMWPTWLAVTLAVSLTMPWYLLTYRMSANGFIYHWGLTFTTLSLPFYCRALVANVGPALLLMCFVGLAATVRDGLRRSHDNVALSMTCTLLALFAFDVIAPAGLQARYLIPVIAPLAVVSVDGLCFCLTRIQRGRRPLYAAALGAGLLISGAYIFSVPHVSTLDMDKVAETILSEPSASPLVLVDAGPNGEGALITAFAERDPGYRHYILRGTQALAQGNFLGTDYRVRYLHGKDVARFVSDAHIGWVVLDTSRDSLSFMHNRQVLALVSSNQANWRLIKSIRRRDGDVRVYRTLTATASRLPDCCNGSPLDNYQVTGIPAVHNPTQ